MRKIKSFYTYISEGNHDDKINEWLNENTWCIYQMDNGMSGDEYPIQYTFIHYEEGCNQ